MNQPQSGNTEFTPNKQDFLAKEFGEFLNASFDNDPPQPGSWQYIQLRFAFYGGALVAQGQDLVPELLMFYGALKSAPGLTVKEGEPCQS